MPELPDVEVFKDYVNSTALHKRIESVEIRSQKILKHITSRTFLRQLKSRRFVSSRRHGKFLFIELDGRTGWLGFHFGMTGFLRYFTDTKQEPPHVRLLIRFTNGAHLAFDCQRLFGEVTFAEDDSAFIKERKLGPDALNLGWGQFKDCLAGKKGVIKAVLMDQGVIAGLGNVYSDEILFQAQIHPLAKLDTLKERSLRAIHKAMGSVLHTAIAARADPARVPKSWLLPHRGKNAPCPRCGNPVERITLNRRSAYLCPHCQQAAA